jgi:hypothetical protein
MFQRGYPFGDEEDDGVYVEVNDQCFSGYDAVSMCEVSASAMKVTLGRPLGSKGQVTGVEVRFAHGNAPPPQFIEHLRSIFTSRESQLRIHGGAGGVT